MGVSLYVVDNIFSQAADEGDIGARPYGGVDICLCRGAGKSRVYIDEGNAPFLGLGDMAEAGRVVLGRIGADDQDNIGIGNIGPVVGHGPSAKRFRQTGDSGGMSYTGLVFDIDQTQGPQHLY
ncbi:hypothetical protein ES703_106169 [subsurface metagenome]